MGFRPVEKGPAESFLATRKCPAAWRERRDRGWGNWFSNAKRFPQKIHYQVTILRKEMHRGCLPIFHTEARYFSNFSNRKWFMC